VSTYFIDSEVYKNFFLVGGKTADGKVFSLEMSSGESLDTNRLKRFMLMNKTVGFNSRSFDLPVIYGAIAGLPTTDLKAIADKIILGGAKSWDIEKEYGFEIPRKLDHIDLIEIPIGQASLKIYGGRIHAPRMQDLPIEPEALLTTKQMDEIYDYWINDLDTTHLLFEKLKPEIELREKMSEEYGQDLRSKSDAQIAEAVIKVQVSSLLDMKVKKPEIRSGTTYNYTIPSFIKFKSGDLNDMLEEIRQSKFIVSKTGNILMPKALEDAKISIGEGVYRLGIGGLHSSEQTTSHVADDETILIDRDVASYYPAIIINQGLHPAHMGWAFLRVYKKIVARRLKAKARVAELKKQIEDLKVSLKELDFG
jgi:hypothetical protein